MTPPSRGLPRRWKKRLPTEESPSTWSSRWPLSRRGLRKRARTSGRVLQPGAGLEAGACLGRSAPPAFRSGLDCPLVAEGGVRPEATPTAAALPRRPGPLSPAGRLSLVSVLRPAHQRDLYTSNLGVPYSELAAALLGLRVIILLSSTPKSPAFPPPTPAMRPLPLPFYLSHAGPLFRFLILLETSFTYRQIHRYKYILILTAPPPRLFLHNGNRHTLPCLLPLNNVSYRSFYIRT